MGVEHGFGTLGFRRLVSICIAQNVESRRVMEKLGFRPHVTVLFEPLEIDLLVHARDASEA